DGELLFETREAFTDRWERDPVRGVLAVVPARAEAELDPSAAHLVDLRDRDRERSWVPERHGCHEGAEPDARRVAREGGEREPGVGRPGKPVAGERHVVIGAEEGVEAELLGEAGERREIGVVRTLLGLGEDP